MTPEHLPRPIGSYDPDERLVTIYGDSLASRNAVSELVMALKDVHDPPSDFQKESARIGLRFAVSPRQEDDVFETFEQAVQWLVELHDRLRVYLPTLPPGPQA